MPATGVILNFIIRNQNGSANRTALRTDIALATTGKTGTADSTKALATTPPILQTVSLTKLATSLALLAGADLRRIRTRHTLSRNIPRMVSRYLRALRGLPLRLHENPPIESRQNRHMAIFALLLLVLPNVPRAMGETWTNAVTL